MTSRTAGPGEPGPTANDAAPPGFLPSRFRLAPLLLLLGLCAGCRGKVVGQLSLTSLQSKTKSSFDVDANATYRLWERYKYDNSGMRQGAKRERCYRWRVLVTQKRDATHYALRRELSCRAFARSGCTSSSYRTGWVCRLDDCDSELAFPVGGKASIEAQVVEAPCNGGRSFDFPPAIQRLQLQLVKK